LALGSKLPLLVNPMAKRVSFLRQTAWYFVLLVCVSMVGCKQKQYLIGYYDWNQFQESCKWEHFTDEGYSPSSKWLDSLSLLKNRRPVDVRLFLGCYCGDSKKWVPRFFDLAPQLPLGRVEIISVDTTKKDEMGLASLAKVDKIPTFIFLDNQAEIGRIVEKPKHGSLEKNIYRILKNDG